MHENVTNSRIALCLLSWQLFNSSYSLTSSLPEWSTWKEVVQNVVFVSKSSFYLGVFPMSSCLKQALCSCLKQSLCSWMSNCYNYLHIRLEKSSLTCSHSVSLYYWEWNIVDMISHQFSIQVRNIMHGLKVPDLKPLLWKATSQRTKYVNNFVNIWSPEDLRKQAKRNKTHYKNVLEVRLTICCGKSGGSHLSIQLPNNIFH